MDGIQVRPRTARAAAEQIYEQRCRSFAQNPLDPYRHRALLAAITRMVEADEVATGTSHPQVTVVHPSGADVDVDAGMADLVTTCWAAGLDTRLSCQDISLTGGSPDNNAWLTLDPEPAHLLLRMVGAPGAAFQSTVIASALAGTVHRVNLICDERGPSYRPAPGDGSPTLEVEVVSCDFGGRRGIESWVGVRFPAEDIPAWTDTIRQAITTN